MGYIPHIIGQRNSLLPMVTLRIIDQLECLFPENLSVLSIVKRNFAWKLKVETTGNGGSHLCLTQLLPARASNL